MFWRWKEDDAAVDELDHVTPHKPEVQAGVKRQREFLVKWHDMSYWHCEWISELQVGRSPFLGTHPHFLCTAICVFAAGRLPETVTHVAEAAISMAEVEETTPATTTETAIATQEVRQRHLLGPEEEVIEATIETEKVI